MSLYDDPDLYDALLPIGTPCIDFYVGLAREQAGPVLELACGSGQLLVRLAATGLPVTGLDNAQPMLDAARRRADAANVAVDLQLADMRSFALSRRFALIAIARNSLLHMLTTEDLLATLATVRDHLAPGGIFAFDVFHPNPQLLALPVGHRRPLMTVASEQFGEIKVEAITNYDPASQVNRGTWMATTSKGKTAAFDIHVRSIFPQELPLLLRAAGLELVSRFGNYTREPFESHSPRQVCIASAR
jgi:SAM-dependent methyltransferase